MLVLAISRLSLKMGHVGLKTRSPCQILFVFTLEATIVTRLWWHFVRMFVLVISRPSSNMGQVGLNNRSPGQIWENSCFHCRRRHICDQIDESWQYLGQVRIWVMEGKQTRSNLRQLLCILEKLRPSNLDHLYNLVCEIELWHFITLNLTLWPTFTF